MLWFKGWLETRFRALFGIGVCLFIVFINRHTAAGMAGSQRMASVFAFVWAIIPSMTGLAGGGVRTQPAFQAIKGLHGSMYFTLSLPVSRMRILAIRAALGWTETAAVIALVCATAWAVVPGLKANVPVAELAGYFLTVTGCISIFYFLSVLFSIFLDAQWLPFAGLLSVLALSWALPRLSSLPFLNVFQAMGVSSPLFTHTIPWASVAASVGMGIILLFAAGAVVQRREY